MKKLLCVLMFGMVFGQTELTTRVYELPRFNFNGETIYLDLTQITGYNLDYANINIAKITDFQISGESTVIQIQQSYLNQDGDIHWSGIGVDLYQSGSVNYFTNNVTYDSDNQLRLRETYDVTGYADIIISITAEFPEEDTGYIEEGFDYCIDVGANLIASPCRDAVPILDTLPSEIADNLTGIIGQGVAATNQNGNWVGSLDGLGGGNGYWMISNVNACFNYNCAEN